MPPTLDPSSDAIRVMSRASSISPTTPSHGAAPAAGREGRLSGLVETTDVDTFKTMMAARNSMHGVSSKAGWLRSTSTRQGGKGGQQSTSSSSRFLGVGSNIGAPSVAARTSPMVGALAPPAGAQHSSVGSSAPNLNSYRIALNHLSVEETIHLRNVFDCHSIVESSASGDNGGFETTVSHALDIFTVTSLLHHAKILASFPSDSDLRRMIIRVAVANAQIVARPTNAEAVSAASMEPVVEFPTELSFQIYLQLAELCKRWALREDDEDEVVKAYTFYTKNRRYIKAVDDATIQAILSAGKWPSNFQSQLASSAAGGSVTPSGGMFSISSNAISPSMLDLDGSQQPPSHTFSPGLNTSASAGLGQHGNAHGHLNVNNLQDVLKSVGAEYDFQTLFASVDPSFDDSKIDQRLFRWIAGQDDPDIVSAFVSLGGEEGLSGTITVDRLIAKCEAMQMTPQYIANFVALVDPNQDGVVDFTEFLSLLVRNRQELSGERKGKLTERGGSGPNSAFRFGTAAPQGALSRGGRSADATEANLPFPRQKRFSRVDEGSAAASRRVSLPFQGFDEDELETEANQRLFFQEKVRSIFDDPDVILLEEDSMASPRGATQGAFRDGGSPVVQKSFDSDDDDDEESPPHDDSFGSADFDHDSPRARAIRKRLSVQETHLGIGLAGILKAKSLGKAMVPLSIGERIEQTFRRGVATISQHREKVETVMQDMDKRRQRKYIRTDDGLVEGNRETGESAMKQKQRLRTLRVERAARRSQAQVKPPPPRVAAMSQRAVEQLKREVSHLAAQLEGSENTKKKKSVVSAAARSVVAPPSTPPVVPLITTPPSDAPPLVVTVPTERDVTEQRHQHRQGGVCPPAWPRGVVTPSSAPLQYVEHTVPIPSRPPTTSRLSRPTSATARPPSATVQPKSDRVPPEKAHKQVKLEDPLSLWKLLEANHRRMVSDEDHPLDAFAADGSGGAQRVTAGTERDANLATRRAFARTIASHLTLRLPYDDHLDAKMGVVGTGTPAAIHQAYILNAPAPRPLNASAVSPRSRPHSGANGISVPRGLREGAVVSASGGMTSTRQPTRPQTAPTRRQSQRPMSAKTSVREAQLSRATNCTPTPPTQASRPPSRPCSAAATNAAITSKQFGVGGTFDVDDGMDDGDVVYV